MASSATFGQILGRRLAHYRERAGYTQPQLAQRLAELGFDIGRVTIANIEAAGREGSTAKNRTRADNATMVDVLALAAALDVPPPLLFVPVGDTEEVEFGAITMHPDWMLRWVAGDEPLGRLGPALKMDETSGRLVEDEDALTTIPIGRARWSDNAQPIRLFRQLHALWENVVESSSLRDRLDVAGNDPQALEEVQGVLDRHLRALDRHHRRMKDAGLSVPEISDRLAARIMYLRTADDDR